MDEKIEKWLHGDQVTPKEPKQKKIHCYTIKIVYSEDLSTTDILEILDQVLQEANNLGAAYLTNHIVCEATNEKQILDELDKLQIEI